MLISFRRSARCGSPRGFTLIELLVVTAIIVLITAFVLFRQEKFDSATLLRSLSYSVALTVRQAQVYGVSVRGDVVGAQTKFAPAYGVYFDTDPHLYYLFADLPDASNKGDGQFARPAEQVTKYTVGKKSDYKINSACSLETSGSIVTMLCTATCPTTLPSGVSSCTPSGIAWLTIVFRRPNPDACVATDLNAAACATGAPGNVYSGAYVQLSAIADPTNTHAIKVSTTGQIEVLGSGK